MALRRSFETCWEWGRSPRKMPRRGATQLAPRQSGVPMQVSSRSTTRTFVVFMLLAGLLGHFAAALLQHLRLPMGSSASSVLAIIALLKLLPYVGWVVLLVTPGWRRWGVGTLAFALVLVAINGTGFVIGRFVPRPNRARPAVLDNEPRRGDTLTLPPLTDIDGNAFELGAYKQRPVVLNIWRSWCVPCRKEMPELQELDGRVTSLGALAVLGVNDEPVFVQRDARDELGVRFRMIHHNEGLHALDARRYPTTMIVLDGRVLARWSGTKNDLAAFIEQTLRASKP